MQVLRFGLGMRFDVIDAEDAKQSAGQFWEEILSVLTVAELAGLHVYGGLLEKSPHGQAGPSYLCVFTGGSLKQMRRIYRKLDNDEGVSMYLCPAQPFLQNNALSHIEGLTYFGKVHRDGSLLDGDEPLFGLQIHKKHGKKRPVGKGIRFLIAPEAFGPLTPTDVVKRLTVAARRQFSGVRILPLPMAYGGVGTVDSLLVACDGAARSVTITGLYGQKAKARYGVLRGTLGVIEAGLTVGEGEGRLETATSYGVGELIRRALDEGLQEILVGVEEYTALDGGLGCLCALGVKALDGQGRELQGTAGDLQLVKRLDTELMHPRIKKVKFAMLGASCEQAKKQTLQSGYWEAFAEAFGQDCLAQPGAGAGGGLGAVLLGALGAAYTPGVGALLDAARFDNRLKEVSLVVTGAQMIGEHCLQLGQPLGELACRCQKHHVPLTVITSELPQGARPLLKQGVGGVVTVEEGLWDAGKIQEQLDEAAERMFHLIRTGREMERITALRRKKK